MYLPLTSFVTFISHFIFLFSIYLPIKQNRNHYYIGLWKLAEITIYMLLSHTLVSAGKNLFWVSRLFNCPRDIFTLMSHITPFTFHYVTKETMIFPLCLALLLLLLSLNCTTIHYCHRPECLKASYHKNYFLLSSSPTIKIIFFLTYYKNYFPSSIDFIFWITSYSFVLSSSFPTTTAAVKTAFMFPLDTPNSVFTASLNMLCHCYKNFLHATNQ